MSPRGLPGWGEHAIAMTATPDTEGRAMAPGGSAQPPMEAESGFSGWES